MTEAAAATAQGAPAGNQGGNGNEGGQSLGWRAGLPDEFKNHEAFTPFKTVGDLAKVHIETATRAKDLESKLADSIPKLPENATQEERDVYFASLGRPSKAEEYVFEGEDKNAPEWTNHWKNEFYKLGLSGDTAKALSVAFNSQMQKVVEAHNAEIQKQIGEAATKLKAELGDKYDASIELAQRLWKRDVDGDLEKDFQAETSKTRYSIIRYILKMASKTGEDTSLRGASERKTTPATPFINYDKSPAPPPRN
jgi:hypothetical protein